MDKNLAISEAVVLCGGLGSRLREVVNDRPKPMADFHGQSFLEFLLNELHQQGITRVILSTGYMSDYISQRVEEWSTQLAIEVVVESELLGTGGAIANAINMVQGQEFFVLNGDSFCQTDFEHVVAFHYRNNAQATIVATQVDDISAFGSIDLTRDGQVLKFTEKQGVKSAGLVNAGIYIFNKILYNQLSQKQKFSLEYDIFPKLIKQSFYCYVVSSPLYDIGTPDSYQRALVELGK